MNSDFIFDTIEEVASTSKTKQKLEIINSKLANNELVASLFKFTYDPLIRFGVRDVEPLGIHGTNTIDFESVSLLNNLYESQLTGNAAREALKTEFERLTEKSANLLYRVIQKDLRAGFSDSTVNKVYKNLIPEFPYMRCLSSDWLIKCSDGQSRKIGEIVDNDLNVEVLSIDSNGNESFKKVTNKFNNGNESNDWYVITYKDEDGTIKQSKPVTGNHSMFLSDMTEKNVEDLVVGDNLF